MLKVKRISDPSYLKSFAGAPCYACGVEDGTIVPAHIRHGFFGIGAKPGDDLALPLCGKCHAKQHHIGEAVFWWAVYGGDKYMRRRDAVDMAKCVARLRYAKWKNK